MTVQEIPSDLVPEAQKRRAELVEKIAGEDDQLLEKFLEEKEITVEELQQALRKAVLAYRLIPVFAGSALKNKGVQLLLDAVCYYLPSPLDRPPVEGINPATGEAIVRSADEEGPFAALVFKIASDPYVGSLDYFRVYSGKLVKGSYVLNTRSGKKERIGRIMKVFANKREELETIAAGQIGATVGLKDVKTGDTICDLEHPIVLEQINFPEAVISIRVEPKTQVDQVKLDDSLKKLSDEDPTFKVKQDRETGETIISGMGELHLEIIVDRLKRDFGLEVNVGRPEVAYRETITQEIEAQGKYIHQSGGRGQYGDVWLKLTPLARGEGFEFVDQIKGGVIPQEFIPAVKKGVKEAMEEGVVASYPVIDVQATLYDGSFHDVDSSEAAFKIAAVRGFRKAMNAAKPVLLEPIMRVQATTPPEFLGDVMGDLSSRRGRILENEDRKGVKIIEAEVPLAEMFGYATALRSLTKGRAGFTMEFKKYQPVPESVKEKIVSGRTT
jgi:elongation factor G